MPLCLPVRQWLNALVVSLLGGLVPAQAETPASQPSTTQIIAWNAKVKGGEEAWRKVKSMVWTGYAVNALEPLHRLPFALQQKRPSSTRFEMNVDGQQSVRVFSGTDGWKVRAASDGKPELKPYSPDELKFAHDAAVIDGPLMDFVAKGCSLSPGGIDTVDSRKAYVLNVTTPEGEMHRVWVDAESFLELRVDRSFHNSDGRISISTVRYRDYHEFEGLQMAVTVEMGSPGDKTFNRLVIEQVALNSPLTDSVFDRPLPPITRRAGGVAVDTRSAALSPQRRPSAPP